MESVAMPISVAIFILGLGAVLISYMKGREEYSEIAELLDEKEFKLKGIICSGLYIAERFDISEMLPVFIKGPMQRYNNIVAMNITEIYGIKERDFYIFIHKGNKIVCSMLVYIFISIFAMISASNSDYNASFVFSAAAPISLFIVPFLLDKELFGKIAARREQIQLEFPEFVNKLILLVNAGATIPKAWAKIVSDSKSNSPLYRELRICMAEIKSGKSEAAAYEDFARRCKIKEVIKFVSVIILNLRKGGSEVIPALSSQADECWELRKAVARRLGEKASSKLMLPMAIMLVGIIMIVALPAVLALCGL